MPRFTVTCTYETRSGGCSWGSTEVNADTIIDACRIGAKRITDDGRRQIKRLITTKARLSDEPRQFGQARFVMHGENMSQLPKGAFDHDRSSVHLF